MRFRKNPTFKFLHERTTSFCAKYFIFSFLTICPFFRTSSQTSGNLTGGSTICDGDSTLLNISLTGEAPFTIKYFNGTSVLTKSGITTNNYAFKVAPSTSTTYTLVEVIDANDTVPGTGSASVPVNLKPFSGLGYHYEKNITIKYNNVDGPSDLIDFPVLIYFSDSDLKNAPTGHVLNSNGWDIAFTDVNGNLLSHELEKYDGDSGEIICWVKVPVLSVSQNTIIKMLYGNSQVNFNPSSPRTWNENYLGVWHLSNDLSDATVNQDNGTNFGTADTVGIISRARTFHGDQEIVIPDNIVLEPSSLTVSAWFQPMPGMNSYSKIVHKGDQGAAPWCSYSLERRPDSSSYGFQIGKTDSLYDPIASPAGSVAESIPNNWYYSVGTYNDSTFAEKYYLNGILNAYRTTDSFPILYGLNHDLHVGSDEDQLAPFGRHFIGYIDEVRLLAAPLTDHWIKTEYDNQVSPSSFLSVGTENIYSAADTIVCFNDDISYSIPNIFSSYSWNVKGGIIMSGLNTNQILVKWNGTAPYSISLVVNENSCNSGFDSINMTVFYPSISCKGNQGRYTDTGLCTYTTVGTEFDPSTTGDKCSVDSVINNLTLTNTLAGHAFTLGSTNVEWTITDGYGNSSSCNFTITLSDSTKPTPVCRNIILYLDQGTGHSSITTDSINNGSSDNCGISNYSLSNYNFDCHNLGNNNDTLTVTDMANNTANCISVVDVRYSINPFITASTSGDTLCNEQPITINLTSTIPSTSFSWIATSNDPGTTGISNGTGALITQIPNNSSDSVNSITYTITSSTYGCIDDTLVIPYKINPVPKISISYADSIFCDSSLVTFTLNSLNGHFLGQPYYLLQTTYDTVNVSGIHRNGYFPIANFTDSFINRSNILENIIYQITPVFRNPKGTNNNEYCSDGKAINRTFHVLPDLNAIATSDTFIGSINISCNGYKNGDINLQVSGGYTVMPGYTQDQCTFNWSNGVTTRNQNNLIAGIYHVKITDKIGCIFNTSITLTQPQLITSNIVVIENISCDGASNGAISIIVNGGTKGYHYAWTGPDTFKPVDNADLSNLMEGWYRVVISDTNNCTANNNIVLNAPVTISFDMDPSVYGNYNISCYGENDGSFDPSDPYGGTGNLIYEWTDSIGTIIGSQKNINNLYSGIYSLKVTDQLGCFNVKTDTLSEPDSLQEIFVTSSFYNQYQISCFGMNNGSINLTVSGGQGNNKYFWTKDTGIIRNPTVENLAGLTAGVYHIYITDSIMAYTDAGLQTFYCYSNDSVQIIQPQPLTIKSIKSDFNGYNISCCGFNNGSITLQLTGGVQPYNYLWTTTNGSDLSPLVRDQTDLTAGNYKVLISYGQNCSSASTVQLNQPDSVTLNPVVSDYNGYNISCFRDSNGSITTNISGGVGGYQYLWTVLSGNSILVTGAADQVALKSGEIELTITDTNSCVKTADFNLIEPNLLNGTLSLQNITCYNDNDGKASITVSGGVTPYSYFWSRGDTSSQISKLSDGQFSITIADKNNCQQNYQFFIIRPPLLITNIQIISDYNGRNISCYGAFDGIINAQASGGRPPYFYLWNTGNNQFTLRDLGAGKYSLNVKDSSNCITDTSITLIAPAPVGIDLSATMPKCYGNSNGNALAVANGGTQPYNYNWSTGSVADDINNLPSGYYKISVSDINNCFGDSVFYLAEPPKLMVVLTTFQPTCPDVANGGILTNPNGGTPPYQYKWSNNSTDANISQITVGNYTLILSDINGCTVESEAFLTAVQSACIDIPSAFSPNNDGINDTWEIMGGETGNLQKLNMLYPNAIVEVYNRWGMLIYRSESGYPNDWDGTSNGKEMPVGSYYYIINLNDGSGALTGSLTILR